MNFVYHNENPDGSRLNDCVTRAITLCSGMSYSAVRQKLFHTAKLLDCAKLCWTCYMFLIQNVLGYRPVNCDNLTVREFAELNSIGTYLIRIDGHLTSVIDGRIRDTWDCSDRYCTVAWKCL